MAEINVNLTEIDNAITKLHELQSECNSRNTTPPATVGGGKTVNELEDIANIYKTLNTHFETLLSNTISFLQNVRDSYTASDTEAANKIANK